MARIGIDARMMGKEQATGIGNYIYQIVSRLASAETEHEFVIFTKPENKDALEPLPDNFQIKTSNCHWYSLCEQIRFVAQLYSAKLDLLHVPQFNVPLLYRKPFVVTIHDVTPQKFPGHKMSSIIRQKAFNAVFNNAVKNACQIIAVSEYTKQQLINLTRIPQNRVFVTYLGVEKHFMKEPEYGKIQSVLAKFSIDKPYLLYVGVWRPHKNLIGLIEAFALLKKDYDLDLQLVLGGKPDPNYPEISQKIKNLPDNITQDVVTPGFISDDDLPSLYREALAYVVPSFEEGFGINGLEAMASDTPVAASDRASLPEVYGQAARYFDPAKPEKMAEVIASLVNDIQARKNLIAAGRKRLLRYDWDQTAKQTLSIYQSILSKR